MLFLSPDEVITLGNALSSYEDINQLKTAIVNRHAPSIFVMCKNWHLIKVRQEKTATRTLGGGRRKKKLGDIPERCPKCGEEVIVIEYRGVNIDDIVKMFDKARNEIEKKIEPIVTKHPLYTWWLSKVKGVGLIGVGRLIYILETTRNLKSPSPMMARTGFYFVAVCDNCKVYRARNVPPPPEEVKCPLCGRPMRRTIPGKWIINYRPLDWSPESPPKKEDKAFPLPYDPELRAHMYKTVFGIFGYTRMSALPQFAKKPDVSRRPPYYGVWAVYKYYDARSRNVHRPDSAAIYSTGKILLSHLWLVAMCLKYGADEKFWTRTMPEKVRQRHFQFAPLVDTEDPVNDQLYDKIVPPNLQHIVELTYRHMNELLMKLVETYRQRKEEKQTKPKT